MLVAVVSDGAGSAAKGEQGAKLACAKLVQLATEAIEAADRFGDLSEETAREWVGSVRRELERQAAEAGLPLGDYACTLLAAALGESSALFVQLGDGVIVVLGEGDTDEYSWVFWPNRGEYENVTVFLTSDEAMEELDISLYEHRLNEVGLLTDGLQRLALQLSQREVHNPFFLPLFLEVRRSPEKGLSRLLTGQLRQFLSSGRVEERTDDDKTLILATRVGGSLGSYGDDSEQA